MNFRSDSVKLCGALIVLRTLTVVLLFLFALSGLARASCVGSDLIPDLRNSDPAGLDAMFARADSVPNANGRLWEVTKAGSEASYLFGTFHSGEALETMTPRIWDLLKASRVAIFEVDLDQQSEMEARMASDPSFAFDLEGPGVMSRMTASQRQTFSDAIAKRGMDLQASDRMRPWLLAALLSFPACHLQAMASGDQALDAVLAQRAKALGIAEIGLETYETALQSLEKISKDTLVTALTSVPEMLNQDEDLFRTNHILYEEGRIQAINELGIYLTEKYQPQLDARGINQAMMVELLDVRNRAWMPQLSAELSQGNAFVAVGALHLPGNVGLIELLRQQGFKVIPIE